MKLGHVKCLLTFFFVVSLFVCVSGQHRKAEADITAIMKKHDVVGMSVVVVKEGDIVYSNAFGLKDIDSNTPLQESDLFRIASISKSFSATAILQLIEAKKVSLDADFSDLVGFRVRNPKYPDRKITLKMVLSHTSSINDSQGYFNLDVINPEKNKDWAKSYNNYAPGKGYQYCNLNFNLVGAVIEKLSGERFDIYIKNHILNPLALYGGYCIDSLDNSRFVTLYAYDSVSGFMASPMAYSPRREEISNYVMTYTTPIFSPTGGMKISAPDLARYMIMHMNRGVYKNVRIISEKSARIMQKKISKQDGYALAIMNLDNLIAEKNMIGHTGSAYGLYSAMFFEPKEKFGFVVITSGCKPDEIDGINAVLKTTINSLYDNLIKSNRIPE